MREAPDPAQAASGERPGALLRALGLAAVCGFVYLLVVGSFRFDFRQTDYAHHLLMADALLHGQFHIRPDALAHQRRRLTERMVRQTEDYAREQGYEFSAAERERLWQAADARARSMADSDWAILPGGIHYGYWAPLTPVLMMPFVALFGLDVSDQVINALFGALNVGLFYWLLGRVDRAGLLRTSEACRLALTLLLAFGTSHFWLTCTAQVWFAVHIVTLTAVLAALIAACRPAPRAWSWLLAGVFFGAAVLGRNIVILMGLFFVVLLGLQARALPRPRPALALRLALFATPVAVALGVQGAYNYARFGNVQESGLGLQIQSGGLARFRDAHERYGAFSPHYLPHNLYYYFWNSNFPQSENGQFVPHNLFYYIGDWRASPDGGPVWFDSEGNSVFLVTPPMLYLFFAWRRRTPFTLALICGVVPLVTALMLYFATGYVQFGPRYLLDAMPLLLLLVAAGMGGRLTHVSYTLIVLALAAHLFGTARLCENEFAPLSRWMSGATLLALAGLAVLARWVALRASPQARPDGASMTN